MYKKVVANGKVAIAASDDRKQIVALLTVIICDHPADEASCMAGGYDAKTVTDLCPHHDGQPQWQYLESWLTLQDLGIVFIWHGSDGLESLNWFGYLAGFLTQDQLNEILAVAGSYFS